MLVIENVGKGSSPHTRGAQILGDDLRMYLGIIPAYAGSTKLNRLKKQGVEDHPRIRGEHMSHPLEGLNKAGIIPAYAGSTSRHAGRECRCPDHPRIRGEHSAVIVVKDLHAGSSPHTRGARRLDTQHHHRIRIIPAYAGSTTRRRRRDRISGDHPRIRGEHRLFTEYERRGGGSSPHTRGALAHPPDARHGERIIPAYAGSTGGARRHQKRFSDHPRIRGEHFIKYGIVPSSEGSSPHTRGAP